MHHQMSMRGSEKKKTVVSPKQLHRGKKIMDQQASYFRVQTLVREK